VTDAPSVTIVIVNYRTPRLTIDCTESLLHSVGVQPRIIIIDNDSRDDSVEQIGAHFREHPDVTLHARSVNDGYTGGNNTGVELALEAGARFAFVLNSDTIVAPDCLRILIDEMESDPSIALVHPRIFFGDAPELLWFGGSTFSLWNGLPEFVGHRRNASEGWAGRRDLPFASGCALLVRLDACDKPLFDPGLFAYAEDLDLSLQLRKRGRRIRYVPEALVWHYEGSSHRIAGGQALRFYLDTRNILRVVSRHARWFHWPALAPMLAVNVVGRYCFVTLRNGDYAAMRAVIRGAWHAIVGGRHAVEGNGADATRR
jgi:GT2 family glycosyltransferase